MNTDYRAPDSGVTIARPNRPDRRISRIIHRKATNLPIRVPATDWAKIVVGEKRMFRTYSAATDRTRPVVPPDTECPRPCLLYAVRHERPRRRWEAIPGVLLSHRQEPLGSITPEDLEREGFQFLHTFRWYWQMRYKKLGWRPWDKVSVLEVRPWAPGRDELEQGNWLLDQLYGEWLQ